MATSVFPLTLKGSFKTSELMEQGHYNAARSGKEITDERFPIQQHLPLDVTIELLEFDDKASIYRIRERLERRGLEYPTYEIALEFGIKYPEEQRRRTILFLYDPRPLGPNGIVRGLVLSGSTGAWGGRSINFALYGMESDICSYWFAGVRK